MNVYSKCPVCGEGLIHHDDPVYGKCSICGKPCETYFTCEDNHLICSSCRYGPFYNAAVRLCLNTTSKDPIEIAENLMDLPEFGIYGCKHYFVVPFALVTAYNNAGGKVDDLEVILDKIHERLLRYPSSMCKIGGICGVPISAGIGLLDVVSDIGSSFKPHNIGNMMTTECLHVIRRYNPMDDSFCCKRHVYLSILRGAKFIDDNFWVMLTLPDKVSCKYHGANPKCLHNKCVMYYGLMPKPKE